MDPKIETSQSQAPLPDGNQTPPQVSTQPASRSPMLWVIVILLLVLILGGVGGFIYLQSAQKSPTPETNQKIVPPVEPTSTPIVSPTASPSASAPTVTIESEATFPVQDVSELKARVINPFMDYIAEARPDDPLLQVTIKKNLQASGATYPYVLDSLSKNGVTQGGLISKTNGHLDWWFPECLNGCNLSDAYKTKYPEVAKQVN